MPDAGVVVAVVPREVFSLTRRTIETLYERTPGPLRLVCVDGGSPPSVAGYLREAAERLGFTLLRSESYLTPNQARNLAAAEAFGDPATRYVVYVDNDVLVGEGWLEPLVRCADETGAWAVGPAYFEHLPEQSRVHMLGGRCRVETNASGERRIVEKHDHGHRLAEEVDWPTERFETELIEFHAALVSREAHEALGGLDEGLTCHSEHADLCLSVREAGGSVWVEPASRITYAPPKRLAPEDREYFFLRWSEAWLDANRRRFIAKWRLDPRSHHGAEWLREHRRYGLPALATLRRLVGHKLARSLEKRVAAPVDVWLNRRRYPMSRYATPATPRVGVVHRAEATARAA